MKKIPKCFGFPLWTSKVKKRVAKKYINRGSRYSQFARMKEFANYKVGDLVEDCTAFNVKITDLRPEYRRCGKGWVLVSVSVDSARNSADFFACGVDHPKSYEERKAQIEVDIKNWEEAGDEWGFAKQMREGTLNPDGTFTYAEKK